MKDYDVIVIGGGVAGLACGLFLDHNLRVAIVEKMKRPGLKLLVSGSSQCNITSNRNISDFIHKYGKNGKFLIPSFNLFNNKDLLELFGKKGIRFENQDEKVFPVSRNSQDILNSMLDTISGKGFEIKLEKDIKSIRKNGIWELKTENEVFHTKKLIICSGGCSYPKTGSDGKLFKIISEIGIKIKKPQPALTSIIIRNHELSDFSGFSFRNADVTISRNRKKIMNTNGDILITHNGFSGPAILNNSRYINAGDILTLNVSAKNQETIFKELSFSEKSISELFTEYGFSRNIFIFFQKKYPELSKFRKTGEISGKCRNIIIELLTNLRFEIADKSGFDKAMVTCGGVDLKEIDPYTMQSRNFDNLFFAGEVIDIDGDTGGYNIQAAFSTAYTACKAINTF